MTSEFGDLPWQVDRPCTVESAAATIRARFPAIDTSALRYLGHGWEFDAFLTVDGWVFRFPRRAEYAGLFEKESPVLRLLASAGVPPHIALPSVELRGDPTVDFPYPFAGHRFIDGVAADALDENLLPMFAREIAAFMGAVHSIRVSFARASGIPEIDARTHGEGMRAWLDHGVEIVRQLDGRDPEVDRAVEWVARHPMPAELLDAPRVLIHADLVTEHVIVDPATGRIRGVIDWTDAMISDAPRDFVFLATWRGWQFVEEVLRRYPRETDSRFRARLHWMARTLAVMLLATAHERGTELTPHIQAIRNVFATDEIP